MPTLAEVQQLVEELGPSSPDIACVAQHGDAEWAVAYDEDSLVSIEANEDGERLVLTAGLGVPADADRLAVAETLLSYNALWQDHGGVTMALGGPAGELLQIYSLPTAGLTVGELQEVLENFAAKGRIWRGYIADPNAGEAPLGNPTPELGMRV